MAKLDQFESAFRAADKPVYAYKHVEIAKILVVADLPGPEVVAFRSRLQSFLSVLSDVLVGVDGLVEAWKVPVKHINFNPTGDMAPVPSIAWQNHAEPMSR